MHQTADLELQCWVGDKPKNIQFALFADASFASWLGDSKSTSGCFLVLMGPNTFVPISWFCKKQGSVSNSSTESELISLDASLRMEGIPALALWELVIDVFHPLPVSATSVAPKQAYNALCMPVCHTIYDELLAVDYVPCNVLEPNGRAILVLLEDNDL